MSFFLYRLLSVTLNILMKLEHGLQISQKQISACKFFFLQDIFGKGYINSFIYTGLNKHGQILILMAQDIFKKRTWLNYFES